MVEGEVGREIAVVVTNGGVVTFSSTCVVVGISMVDQRERKCMGITHATLKTRQANYRTGRTIWWKLDKR